MARKSATVAAASPQAPTVAAPSAEPRDFFFRSTDGLRLHVREYGDAVSPFLPVVCLPGLTRTARDFDVLARFLSAHPDRPRRVVAFDLRGRGMSEWDASPDNYTPLTEMTDVLDGMAALGIARAIIVGTSRGGIIAMLMGVARPNALAGVVLNDVGAVLEPLGLARIKSYVGVTPLPDDWSDAVQILKRLHGAQFPALDDDAWLAYARMTWAEKDGKPVSDYDPALARTLDAIDFDRAAPSLWEPFRSLVAIPVLAIRGERSDLLSTGTLQAMAEAHPRMESITIEGHGHAPLLRQPPLLARIADFVAGIDGAGPSADAIVPREPARYSLDKSPDGDGSPSDGD